MVQKRKIGMIILLGLVVSVSGLLVKGGHAADPGQAESFQEISKNGWKTAAISSTIESEIGPMSGASPGAVLINEIVTDPQQDWSSSSFTEPPGAGTISPGVDEWVELYITTAGLDLTGWMIELLDGTDVAGDLTSAGAFQISNYIASGGGSFTNTAVGDYLVLGNVAGSGQMNNDILIILKDNTGSIIDKVELGDDPEGDGDGDGAPDGTGNGGDSSGIADEAVARLPNAMDTDNDANDFAQQEATIGTSNNGPLTAITLDSFTVAADIGTATITWQTATEIDNAGFNLLRASDPNGSWVKINAVLIPAKDDALSGASYTRVDTPGRGIYYYRLEDIDYNGVSTLHEPVRADLGPIIRRPWYRPNFGWLGF